MRLSPTCIPACAGKSTPIHAERVIARLGGPLSQENLARLLLDEACLRWPTEIVFDGACLESHQFAQPVIDGSEHQRSCTLYVHPRYAHHPEGWPYFAAYFTAVINYGIAADPVLCEEHGAALLSVDPAEFCGRLCDYVDHASDSTPDTAMVRGTILNSLNDDIQSADL